MSFETINISRQFPIIDGFVRLQPCIEQDRHKYDADSVAELYSCIEIKDISTHKWIELPSHLPSTSQTLCDPTNSTELTTDLITDLGLTNNN